MNRKQKQGGGGAKIKPMQSTKTKSATTPKQSSWKPAETEELLHQEINDLKTENVNLRSNLDPKKIEEELRKRAGYISEFDLTDELQKLIRHADVAELRHEVENCKKEITKQQAEIGQKNTQIDKLTKQLKESENLATVRRKDIEQNRPTEARLRNDIVSLQRELMETQSELNKYKIRLPDLLGRSAVTKQTESTLKLQNECESLKQELQTKTGEISRMEKRTLELQVEIKDLKRPANTDEDNSQITQLRSTIATHEKNIEDQQYGFEQRQNDMRNDIKDERDKHVKTQTELTETSAKLRDIKNTLEQRNNTITKLDEEKQQLTKENEENENELTKLRETNRIDETLIEETKNKSSETISTDKRDNRTEIAAAAVKEKLDEINKLKNELTDLKSANERLKKEKEQLELKCHDAFEQLEAKEKKWKQLETEHKKLIDRKEETINKLRKEKTMVDPTRGASASGEKGMKEKYDKTARELTEAKDEIDELKNRLSKVVGTTFMNDNPNIADLSDENRPTKLSEKYSELYDNEWTDAYEEVEHDHETEEQVINHLYETLLDTFKFCQDIAVEHAKSIQACVLTVPYAENGRPKSSQANLIGVSSLRQLKELRKSFAPYVVDSVFQHYTHTMKIKLAGNCTEKFVKRCVEICWLMNSQDPPVILDTREAKVEFDSDRFRTYTKTGKKFDYVVWPPMLLHKDGPMLCKGVAQGK